MKVAKTLIIGIGTTGQNICEGIARNLSSKYGDYKKASWVGIRVLETAHKSDALDRDDFISMTIESSDFADYTSGSPHVGSNFDWGKWGDSNLLKNLGDVSVGAGNRRMAGRLALFHNYDLISSNIISEIDRLQKLKQADIQATMNSQEEIDIQRGNIQAYIIGSLCGGTGSGCCCDLGYLVRRWGSNEISPIAIFTLPHWNLNNQRLKKNAFVALTELNHYMLNKSVWNQKLPGNSTPAFDKGRPYDVIYLTMPSKPMTDEMTRNESTIASFLTAVCTETSHNIYEANVDTAKSALDTDAELGYLKPGFSSFGISMLEYPGEHISRMCKDRLLHKVYSSWKDDSTKDISQGRVELFEKTPKLVIDKFYDQAIITKYEGRMKEEFDKQKFDKNSSIHNKMDVIFSTITREIQDDIDIKQKADFWIENFLGGLEDRFLNMADKYVASTEAGPGFLSRILKQGKADIDSWAMPKGEIDKAYSSAKLTADTTRKNIKKQTDDYLNIKGLCFLVAGKQKEAWNGVLTKANAYVKDIVRLVAAEKMKESIDPMAYGNNTIQNKYNLFVDRYITRLDNFESAVSALSSFYEYQYKQNQTRIPPINGKQYYKNNKAEDEIEDIYNRVVKDSSKNPNFTIDKRESDMATSVIAGLKKDFVSKLTGSISCFDSKIMPDVKDYLPNDIKKTIDIKANNFFSDLSNYRHIIYSVSEESAAAETDVIKAGSKPSMQTSSAPIPMKFQNDPNVGDINVYTYLYAFCPQKEGPLATKENIEKIKKLLGSKQLTKPVFDSRDPYRIMYLQMVHGTSLAHMNGIMKRNDSDNQALEDAMSCNDFNYWNTRKDEEWTNCLISKRFIDNIKQYWLVYLLIGNYRDKGGNYLICDKDGKPSPWYDINQGYVVVEKLSGNVVVGKERIEKNFESGIKYIASELQKEKSIQVTCQQKIKAYMAQVGKQRFIEILFECLANLDSYYLNLPKDEAEKYIIAYCFSNGLEEDYINFKFPPNERIDASIFGHLWHEKGQTVDTLLNKSELPINEQGNYYYPADGYYCPNGHRLGTDDVEATIRGMISNRFKCNKCNTKDTYWP